MSVSNPSPKASALLLDKLLVDKDSEGLTKHRIKIVVVLLGKIFNAEIRLMRPVQARNRNCGLQTAIVPTKVQLNDHLAHARHAIEEDMVPN